MALPQASWLRQSQISFTAGSLQSPAIVTGNDGMIYFAAFVKGANGALTAPVPSTQIAYDTFVSADTTYNLVVGKYNPRGPASLTWYQYFYNLITSSDSSQINMVIGAENELYVAYTTTGSTPLNLNQALVPPFGDCVCAPVGDKDIVVARINTTGTPAVAWVVQSAYINSCNDESAPQLAIDSTNALLYVAYQCSANILCYPTIGMTNVLVSCFDLSGQQLWIDTGAQINSVGNNDAPTIAADASGGVYIAYETTATVSGGGTITNRQIEMIKFQTTLLSPGVLGGYTRQWVLSAITNIRATGNSYTPVLALRNNNLYFAYLTTGVVSGGTHTSSTNDIVIGSIRTTGTLNWIYQGTQLNKPIYQYTDCTSPYITTDNYGYVYVSLITTSGGNGNALLFKLDTATGAPYYNEGGYNVYGLARNGAPNTLFPLPAAPGSFTRVATVFYNKDMYLIMSTTQRAAGQSKTSPPGAYDLCFIAYDTVKVFNLPSVFSYLLKNKSICACNSPCGCANGSGIPSVAYNVLITVLTLASGSLSSTWDMYPLGSSVARYYTTLSTTPTGGTLFGALQNIASGTTNTLNPIYIPPANQYYYVGITPTGSLEEISANATFMPGVYNVIMGGPITEFASELSCTWEATSPYIVIVQYYVSPTPSLTGGTPIGIPIYDGGAISASNTFTFAPLAGFYYYVGVTPVDSYSGVYNVNMSPVLLASTDLSCTWEATIDITSVEIQYYESAVPVNGSGTPFGVAHTPSGINTDTYVITPNASKYYYVGVTPL